MNALLPVFERPLGRAFHDAAHARVIEHYGLHEPVRLLTLNRLPLCRLNIEWYGRIRQADGFTENADGSLDFSAENWQTVADCLQSLAETWKIQNLLHGWRNEKFDVFYRGEPLFALERAAFRPFGLQSRAVHLNALTRIDGKWRFWLGKRSPGKAVDPGKYDNPVSGGVSAGENIGDALFRESREEAGWTAADLTLASSSTLHSLRPTRRGIHDEILYAFNAVVRTDTPPANQDGEVESFLACTPEELADMMLGNLLTADAELTLLDTFRTCRLLDPSHPVARLPYISPL